VTARRTGVPLVISAPSGCGKTTLCQKLLAQVTDIEFSVSHTTRLPRGNERNDHDYHFVSDDAFEQLVAQSAFLEWAHVHGHRYGTSRDEAEARLPRGIDVLFDIDVQGGEQLVQRLPEAVLVFVLPPSLDVLAQRLRRRGTDAGDEIERRLAAARQEIERASFYTHWIVNDQLDEAVRDLEAILRAERLRRVDKDALRERVFASGSACAAPQSRGSGEPGRGKTSS
jgi:guanylate kinase